MNASSEPIFSSDDPIFDLLETLKPHFPTIAGGFARGTGGVDLEYILSVIRETPRFGTGLMEDLSSIEEHEHDDQRELSKLYNHRADDSLQFNRGQMRTAIHHGRSLGSSGVPVDQFHAFTIAMLTEVEKVGGDMLSALHIAAEAGVEVRDEPHLPLAQRLRKAIVQALNCTATIRYRYAGLGFILRPFLKYEGGDPREILEAALLDADCHIPVDDRHLDPAIAYRHVP